MGRILERVPHLGNPLSKKKLQKFQRLRKTLDLPADFSRPPCINILQGWPELARQE
ncbi:hypothetical protein PXNS11_250429 [Stutzerimonas xanthomarina]|nr:hypothetical protein PXNS11_250429 [Stutzerimonas xanthomarina]